MVEQTQLKGKKILFCLYEIDGKDSAATLQADRLQWDEEHGFLRAYDGETLVAVYDLGLVKIAHIREK